MDGRLRGDGNNQTTDLACNASGQSSTVTKASPGPDRQRQLGPGRHRIHDTVTVTGGFSPGGEVTFSGLRAGRHDLRHGPGNQHRADRDGKATSDRLPRRTGRRIPLDGRLRRGRRQRTGLPATANAASQTSTVAKASPGLAGTATSTIVVGGTITDQATLSGGFTPGGQIVFRAYGPGDADLRQHARLRSDRFRQRQRPLLPAPASPPGPGLYRWTAEYGGDGNNQTAGLACNASGQSSAVGTIDVTLTASAGGGTVGTAVTATATIAEGATPGGQIVFRAFPPGDAGCSGAAAFSSTVTVTGNGSYRSAAFTPTRVGTFRWTVSYSGDAEPRPGHRRLR